MSDAKWGEWARLKGKGLRVTPIADLGLPVRNAAREANVRLLASFKWIDGEAIVKVIAEERKRVRLRR